MKLMRHRIFIAINLPEKTKNQLANFQKGHPRLPVRWVKPANLHLTLAFLGYVPTDELSRVCDIVKEKSSKHSCFSINLFKIDYGIKEKSVPRLIWVQGEKSDELTSLKQDLEKSLGLSLEKKDSLPHITLARIKKWEYMRIEPEERPEIAENISLNFEVQSIEVIESKLKPTGPEYAILESCPLKE